MNKRAYDRFSYAVPISFSYFNGEYCFDTQTLNHCSGGMSFKSNFFLKPGTTLFIRVKEFHPNGSCTGACSGLRSATLAEVKWCTQVEDTETGAYGVGVEYYQPDC